MKQVVTNFCNKYTYELFIEFIQKYPLNKFYDYI